VKLLGFSNKKHLFILLTIIVVQILITSILTLNTDYPLVKSEEEPLHGAYALDIFEQLNNNILGAKYYWQSIPNQPLTYFLTQIFLFGFGKSIFSIMLVNNVFFIIAIFFTYKLSELMFDKEIAIYAVVLLAIIPGYFFWSRAYVLENALVAILPLSMYLLLKTNKFQNTKYSILFGITLGVGMLLKISYIFYFLPILAYYCIIHHKDVWMNKKNLFILLALGFVVAQTWYGITFEQVFVELRVNAEEMSERASLQNIYSEYSLMFYPKIIGSQFLFPVFTLLFIASIYVIGKRKDKNFFLFAIVIPILIFILIPNKQIRYLVPITPFFAQAIAIGLQQIFKKKYLREIVIFAIFVTTILLVFMIFPTGIFFIDSTTNSITEALYHENKPSITDWEAQNLNLKKLFQELDKYQEQTFLVISYSPGILDAYGINFYSKLKNHKQEFYESCFFFEENPKPIESTLKLDEVHLIIISDSKVIQAKEKLNNKIAIDCSRYPYKDSFDIYYEKITNQFEYRNSVALNEESSILTANLYINKILAKK